MEDPASGEGDMQDDAWPKHKYVLTFPPSMANPTKASKTRSSISNSKSTILKSTSTMCMSSEHNLNTQPLIEHKPKMLISKFYDLAVVEIDIGSRVL